MQFKSFVAILLASSAAATPIQPRQDPNPFANITNALNQANLTTLSTILTRYAGTQQGQQFASALSNGNHTVFAPSNAALDPIVSTMGNDTSAIGPILDYHVANGSFPADLVAPARSHSIVNTLLTNDTFVNLGGSPQVQVLEQTPDGNGLVVRRTTGNATVTNTTTYQNLIIHVVDTVLTPPGDLKAVLSSSLVGRAPGGFAGLGGSLQKVGQLENVNNAASTTVFAPIDDAFAAINTTVANLTNDQLTSVLNNHIINGNVIYSPQLNSTSNVQAASGAQLNFTTRDGVPYVNYNQTSARILRSDVATKTGVVHVIDTVLA
ncbi:hypothetical protein FRC12_003887 [Ceratobasidium sp. 428]|nr:hypothetical protein FRC12_003887 [Ceratobasidium sp. 428]